MTTTHKTDLLWKLTHVQSCNVITCTCPPDKRKELLAHMLAGCSILDVSTREAMVSEIKSLLPPDKNNSGAT